MKFEQHPFFSPDLLQITNLLCLNCFYMPAVSNKDRVIISADFLDLSIHSLLAAAAGAARIKTTTTTATTHI